MASTSGTSSNKTASRVWLLVTFALYILVATVATIHHEPWADELHSWNLARGSATFSDLISNTRFEGHPPAWLAVIWMIGKCTRDPFYMQLAQLTIAVLAVYMLMFHTRLPLLTRILLPFGYYFLFEYGVLSRNYGLGVLAALLLCLVIKKEFSCKLLLYYLLLFLMSNVHLLSLLLAGSMHLYFLLWQAEKKQGKVKLAGHAFVGLLVALPAMWFISAPSGGATTVAILIRETAFSRIAIAFQAPVRAFLPVPAWWKYNFWNTQVLIELKDQFRVLKFIVPLLSLALLGWAAFLLKNERKSLVLFGTNIIATFLVGVIFSLHTERYAGFIFIGFVIAYVLYCTERTPSLRQRRIVHVLLLVQMFAGIFAVAKDFVYPFSKAYTAPSLVADLPAGSHIVTECRAVNASATYLEKPSYCIDLARTPHFILWNTDMEQLNRYPNRYNYNLRQYFAKENCREVYMMSTAPPQVLALTDTIFFKAWKVQLVKKEEGSLDAESNLYLYKISRP